MRRGLRLCAWASVLVFTFYHHSMAYEVATHRDFSEAATGASLLSNDETLKRFGLLRGYDDARQRFLNSKGSQRTILELISDGAEFEDEYINVINHFFDPLADNGLLYTSPNWALEDGGLAIGQAWSRKAARNYFFQALSNSSEVERNKSWGRMFEALGHVIHHIQDMAQPQHVRADSHLNIRSWLDSLGLPSDNQLFFENRSRYEWYTFVSQVNVRNLMASGAGATVLNTPRAYWANTSGTGLAQYTNGHFVSQGTNFLLRNGQPVSNPRYVNPVPTSSPSEVVPLRALLAAKGFPMPPQAHALCPQDQDCKVLFFGSDVSSRASSLSIFDEDLQVQGRFVTYTNPDTGQSFQVDRFFALNIFNFDAAHELLIPKATSYSVGLINNFFRGSLKIAPPAQGVYSVVDHVALAGSDPQRFGFNQLKANVRNTSIAPDGSAELMASSGRLYAVAKYRRNTCYRTDLSGEFGAPNVNWRDCYSAIETKLSAPANVPASINTTGADIAFAFPDEIPISAINLEVQVIFRGQLGDDLDALVVETKDISEPTYAYNFVIWDQGRWTPYPTLSPGNYPFREWCLQGFGSFTSCASAMGLTLRYSFSAGAEGAFSESSDTWHDISGEPPFSSLIKMTVPVGKFQRVAVLFDVESGPGLLVQEQIDDSHGVGHYQWHSGTFSPSIIKVNPETDEITPSIVYAKGRGVWVPEADAARLNWLDPYLQQPDWPGDLELLPSEVLF